jgi:peptidoglycan/LPS O-acetylase OafA/YrhL
VSGHREGRQSAATGVVDPQQPGAGAPVTLRYIAELDGLRALAVLPVIAYHFGAPIDGGAGVTVFFALSGYIVTRTLLIEHRRTGVIRLRAFYLRRFRRLLPAATLVVAATVIVGRLQQRPSISREATAALTYWANFERFSADYVYGAAPYAPLEHYWSLAIEEQFYAVLPLLCLLLLPLGRKWLGAATAVMLVASAAFAVSKAGDPRMYFHSAARAGELLVGVLLAVIGVRMRAQWVGYVAIGALLAVFSRVLDPPHVAVAAIACVAISSRPPLLAWRPLVTIGTYSYGLYLWHPLAALLADQNVTRILLTVVLTLACFHLVEFPVRRVLPAPRAITAMVAVSAVGAATLAIPAAQARVEFSDPVAIEQLPGADPSGAAAVRISGAGDSSQMFANATWQAWAAANPAAVTWVTPPESIVPWTSGADSWIRDVAADAGLELAHDGPQGGLDRQGCPLVHDLPIRPKFGWRYGFFDSGELHSPTPEATCDWRKWVPGGLAEMDVDVLVATWAVTAMWNYELPDGRSVQVGDPAFDAILAEEMAEFEAMAAGYGTRVLWLTYQPIPDNSTELPEASSDADAFAAVALQRPCSFDFRTVVRSDLEFPWYQDGYHFTLEGAQRAMVEMLPSLRACAALGSDAGGA